jgi:hypothetical protein
MSLKKTFYLATALLFPLSSMLCSGTSDPGVDKNEFLLSNAEFNAIQKFSNEYADQLPQSPRLALSNPSETSVSESSMQTPAKSATPTLEKPNYTFFYAVVIIFIGAAIGGLVYVLANTSVTPINNEL